MLTCIISHNLPAADACHAALLHAFSGQYGFALYGILVAGIAGLAHFLAKTLF